MKMRKFYFLVFATITLGLNAQNFAWTAQTSGSTEYLRDVFFTDNMNGWTVGDNGTILNTTDGGVNWGNQTSGTTERLVAVYFINANTGWAVGGVNTQTILKTTDGGVTWTDITPSNISGIQLQDIAFADATTGWVINMDSIFISTDGGITWTAEGYNTSISLRANRAIAVTSDSTAYVASKNKRTGVSTAYADVFNRRPSNPPYLWSESGVSQFQTDDKLQSIEFADFEIGFAGGERGILYKLVPVLPGNTSGPWEKNLDLQASLFQTIRSISFSMPSTGMFSTSTEVASVTYALIYHTRDTGTTWSSAPDTIADLFFGTLNAPDANNAWIVGLGGKIYKGAPSNIGISEVEMKNVSVYPNPVSDILNIELNAMDNAKMKYRVLSLSGSLLMNGKFNSNERLSISTAPLNEGLYFLVIENEAGAVNTVKFVKQ